MGWAEEMLKDEDLIHHFVWDAQHISKFSGSSGSWVRAFDEPWTGDRFWEIQVGPYTIQALHLSSHFSLTRQHFQKMQSPSHSVFLQTRQNSLPLVPRRATQ